MLDVRTLVIVLCAVFLISALIVFFAYAQHPKMNGVREWAVSLVLLAVGEFFLFARQELPPELTILMANGLLQAGSAILFLGIQRFLGSQPSYRLAGFIFLSSWIPFWFLYQDDIYLHYRIHLSNYGNGFFGLAAGFLLLRAFWSTRQTAYAVSSMGFLLQGSTLALRSVALFISGAESGYVSWHSDLNAIFFFIMIISHILVTLGLFTLIFEKLHENLNVAFKVEQHLRKEQQNFWAMLSHEFKTPLATVVGSAQLIEAVSTGSDSNMYEAALRIQKATGRLSRLVNKSLMDQWTSATVDALQPVAFDLQKLLAELTQEYHICLKENADNRSWAVEGDPQLLATAVSSLIDNALKYAKNRENCYVLLRHEAQRAVIDVFNDGPGISAKHQTRVFEKFYRTQENPSVEGSGLGLFIAKKIIDLHRAEISLISQSGLTQFRITIPCSSEQ